MKQKTLLTIVSVALILALTVGGTLAYLQDKTEEKVNTFQKQTISISLNDASEGVYDIIPGYTVTKRAATTVSSTLDAWVFLKEEPSSDEVKTLVTYAIDQPWQPLGDAYPGVYFTEIPAGTSEQSIDLLVGDRFSFAPTITKQMMNYPANNPLTLDFTTYVIQKPKSGAIKADGSIDTQNSVVFTAEQAWAEILNPTVPSPTPSPSPSPAQP